MQFRKKSESSNAKAALKVAQTGTPVPEKDSSPKGKIAAASNGASKGSLAVAKRLPTETGKSTPEAGGSKDLTPPKKTWEGSPEDWSKDYNAAKRKGITPAQYEDSAEDRTSSFGRLRCQWCRAWFGAP